MVNFKIIEKHYLANQNLTIITVTMETKNYFEKISFSYFSNIIEVVIELNS